MSTLVFLSHSTKDRSTAETICSALENRGLRCWMSSRDIGPGENFQVAILRAIQKARVMVLVFSGNSNNSDEVKKEIAIASQNKLIVIPVRLEDVVPAEAFQYELATRQWIDLFENWEHSIERLVSQINAVVNSSLDGTPAEPSPVPPPPRTTGKGNVRIGPAPAKPRTPTGLYAAIAAVVIALAGGGAYFLTHQETADDHEAWSAAARSDTVAGYQTYIRIEPDGRHVSEADKRITALNDAVDDADWVAAKTADTPSAFDAYRQKYPDGRHKADAGAEIARLQKAELVAKLQAALFGAGLYKGKVDGVEGADTDAALHAYQAAKALPQSAGFDQALIDSIIADNLKQASAIAAKAQADAATAAKERSDFGVASQQHSRAGYQKFLTAHPDGANAAEAQKRLASCHIATKTSTAVDNNQVEAPGVGTGTDQSAACATAEQNGAVALRAQCGGTISGVQMKVLGYQQDVAKDILGSLFSINSQRVIARSGTCNVNVVASCSVSHSVAANEERCD